MKYNTRIVLAQEVINDKAIRKIAHIAYATFGRKFKEDNVSIPDKLFVDITISDKAFRI